MLPAQPADAVLVEGTAAGREMAGLVEVLGELGVGVGRAEVAQDLEHDLRACAAGGRGPQHGQLVAGPRAPVDPDADLGLVGPGGERDVGDQRAQQPLAITVRGGGRGPQARQVAGQRLDVGARGRCGLDGVAGELGFGVGELAQLGLPARLEGASDEPVVGVALMEGALGARGVVAARSTRSSTARVARPRRSATVSAAVSASAIWSGATAASSRSATARSTTSPITPRQPGVAARSARL